MRKIPLHSLVILVGPTEAGKTYLANKKFMNHEILNSESIRHELVGDHQRPDINEIVIKEMVRRTILKLELGERVIIDSKNLKKTDRLIFTNIAIHIGVPIYYLVIDRPLNEKLLNIQRSSRSNMITKHDHLFKSNEREILKGDGIANVIDTRNDDFEVVTRLDGSNMIEEIKNLGYRGITAVGDVHGMLEPLKNATEWATSRNLFVVFLGDILDYGPNSLECVDFVYDIITRGRGVSIIGNHERKIERWLDQVKQGDIRLRLSDGNKVTTQAIEALSSEARRKFEIRYRTLLGFSRHHWVIGDTLFTHGAAEAEMFTINSSRLHGKFETMALFGEIDEEQKTRLDGYPNRIYSWIDRIPKDKRVVVGHDIRSTFKPLIVKGSLGGEACFMDTGSGKGGRLTSSDMFFEENQLIIKAFTIH